MWITEWCDICKKNGLCWIYPLRWGPTGPKEPQEHP